ncbi:MAG TPA: ATP-binding protein [Gemmataceae bacterium]|nr:ATP-binding protein [Gemmataceae bacterium]
MRIGLAAKLCLLAATLVLGTTYASGTLFYQGARAVVRERELADLRDEAALQARELIHELQTARSDLITLSGSAEVSAVAAVLAQGGPPTANARAAVGKVFRRLLEHQVNYLSIVFIRNDSGGSEIAHAVRNVDERGDDNAADRRWLGQSDFEQALRLPPLTVGFSDVRPPAGQPRPTASNRALEQILTLAVHPPDVRRDAAGVVQPLGVLLLRLDFGALVSRLNASPRVLGFLVNAGGQYLANPSPAGTGPGAGAASGSELDRAFAKLHEQSAAKANDRRPLPGGMQLNSVHLPGLEFFLTTGRIGHDVDADRLRKAIAEVHNRHPGVRGEGIELSDSLILRGFDESDLRAAMTEFQTEFGSSVDWETPYRCAEFTVYLLPVRLDPDSPRRAVTTDRPSAGNAQWLGLGLALPHEAMDHEMQANYARTRWYSIALGGIAGAGAFVFALYLTRPLRQMIGVAQQVADGRDADVSLPALRGRDEIGTLARALSSMMDQVRRRTRELRESEARIRTILNTAAEGIVTIDEHGRLESFNQAAERIFGHQADEVRGKHFTSLLQRGAPRDMPTLLGSVVLPSGSFAAESSMYNIRRVTGTTREVIGRRRDGAAFPVEMAVSEVVLGDRLIYTAILRDITERKQAESQIRHMTEELEHRVQERTAELMQANQSLEGARDLALAANRAKDAFLATMSHELRTPLNAIIGYCDYWLAEAEELNPDEMRDDLRKMNQSGKHLLTLINDILDLAKIQAGKVTLDPADFEVAPLLAELREWVEPLVRKNDNTLTLECRPDIGTMRADRTRVRQVLLNLLSNAAKFTKAGSIRLRAERQGVGDRKELVFAVIDTGIGMKPEDVRRLFRETFFQAETSGTRKQEGTGLGLAICKKLCLMMGGDIEVQSKLGSGTTFTVRLPAVNHLTTQPPHHPTP